ncbi:MAG: alpha/beta fold hydrolase [Acidimicrobiales bacterium]
MARVGDVELCYETAGSGPPVVFISGTGGDLRQRPSVIEGPLVEHCTVLAYDQRGLGRSSKPDRPTTMAHYADDAAGLLEGLGWSGAGVVGASFGGMVAQELAIRHPERVGPLVLCCTSSGGGGGSSYPLHELEDLDADERLRTTLALSDLRYDREWQRANPTEADAILDLMRARDSAAAAGPGAEVGARRQLEARRGHDTWDVWTRSARRPSSAPAGTTALPRLRTVRRWPVASAMPVWRCSRVDTSS